jgi:4-hydroxy-tetrahydrodipicolinate reductase
MLDQVLELLGRACAQDGDWETQLSEMHHTRKVDRPSGTALALAKALVRGGLAVDPDSIESIRRDEEPGTHDVVLSTPLERVTIRHEALDRSLFAFGAIDMARSLKRCPAGQFSAAQLRPLSVIDGF